MIDKGPNQTATLASGGADEVVKLRQEISDLRKQVSQLSPTGSQVVDGIKAIADHLRPLETFKVPYVPLDTQDFKVLASIRASVERPDWDKKEPKNKPPQVQGGSRP